MKLLLLVALIALWSACHGYYDYQIKLPNGQHVPHPCKPNFIWHGLGHINPLGGGERSQFGKDFARLGHKWSVDLCRLDSDGDGLTNGQELGDPTCVWREGAVPQQTDNITHPGVCDPWDSARCRTENDWVTCDVGDFKCDAIHEPEVKTLELRFPRTKVPPVDTTYNCFVFDVPDDQPYHMIAFEPIIDNPNVMHHIVATVCDETAEVTQEPHSCMMGIKGCEETIAVWTLGMPGDCFHKEAGFRFGKGASRRLALQFHWTNVHHVDHWYDSSGIKMYYTPNLRPNNAGVMTIGQTFFEIPPGLPSVVKSGTCTSECTRKLMKTPVKVVSSLNHMHYLGIGGKMEQFRSGHVVYNLTNDQPYSYDSPKGYYYETPIEILPGDELKMTCEYSSMNRHHTTRYGPGSLEEMCYGLITYYPKESFVGNCIQWMDFDQCVFGDNEFYEKSTSAFNESLPETGAIFKLIFDNCNVYGSCRSECPAAIAEARKRNPTYAGEVWEMMKMSIWENKELNYGRLFRFVSAFDTCDRKSDQSASSTSSTSGSHQGCQMTHNNQMTSGNEDKGGEGGRTPGRKPDAVGTFLELAKALGSKPLLQNIIFNVNEN